MSFAIKEVSRLYPINVWLWNSIKWVGFFFTRAKKICLCLRVLVRCVLIQRARTYENLRRRSPIYFNMNKQEITSNDKDVLFQAACGFVCVSGCSCIHRQVRTHKQERGGKKWKTKLHLHRQSKLHWLSCVSYNVVITSIRIPSPCCENESLIWQRFPSTPSAFVPHSYEMNHFITMRCEM